MPKSAFSRILCIIAALAFTIFAASLALSWRQNQRVQMRAAALPVTTKQAQTLIQAINRYKHEHDSLPQTLSVLVPRFIPQIPDAGPAAKNGWHYQADTNNLSGGWALFIRVRDEYSPNVMGFGDTFVYHPSGQYPDVAYGGALMPADNSKWGYYVE